MLVADMVFVVVAVVYLLLQAFSCCYFVCDDDIGDFEACEA